MTSANFTTNATLQKGQLQAPMSKPMSQDMSGHFSKVAAARYESPLKGLYKYYHIPGMVICAGGIPSPAMFPFESLTAQVVSQEHFRTDYQTTQPATKSWLSSLFGSSNKSSAPKSTSFSVPKWSENNNIMDYQLSVALQYAMPSGLPPLAAFCRQFTELVYKPAYADWSVLLNSGNTDAWSKVALTLCNPGETILVEEATYPAATATVLPQGVHCRGVAMDGQGMLPDALEEVLASWDEEAQGARRPHLLYTIPVCQNPTGATNSAARKQALYNICCKYDVIICEDDPYYYLQAGDYQIARHRRNGTGKDQVVTDKEFLDALVPSYLTFDTQGRVIRIESFSKTLCPGSRMGWYVASPQIIGRLERACEVSTGSPSGFSQVLLGKLLSEEWGVSGYLRWLKGVKSVYRARRNDFVDLLLSQPSVGAEVRLSSTGAFEFSVSPAVTRSPLAALSYDRRVLYSFVPPAGGMFVWLRVHFSNHPEFPRRSTEDLSVALFETMAQRKVLVALGSYFASDLFPAPSMQAQEDRFHIAENGDGFFRLAFSSMDYDKMVFATKTIAESAQEFFCSA